MAIKSLREVRKEMFDQIEKQLPASRTPEEDMFYYHASEDRIVLSHALFWVMTQSIRGKIAKEKYLLLLRQYQEEMLEAYLTDRIALLVSARERALFGSDIGKFHTQVSLGLKFIIN